jgi:hypothetical protein
MERKFKVGDKVVLVTDYWGIEDINPVYGKWKTLEDQIGTILGVRSDLDYKVEWGKVGSMRLNGYREKDLELYLEKIKSRNFKIGDKVRIKTACSGTEAGQILTLKKEEGRAGLWTGNLDKDFPDYLGCGCENFWELVEPSTDQEIDFEVGDRVYALEMKVDDPRSFPVKKEDLRVGLKVFCDLDGSVPLSTAPYSGEIYNIQGNSSIDIKRDDSASGIGRDKTWKILLPTGDLRKHLFYKHPSGVVIDNISSDGHISVEFDNLIPSGHSCGGRCVNGFGLFFNKSQLTLIRKNSKYLTIFITPFIRKDLTMDLKAKSSVGQVETAVNKSMEKVSKQTVTPNKGGRTMFDEVKGYFRKNADTVMTVGLVVLVDHFLFDGALRERIKKMLSNILGKAEEKLSEKGK